MGKAKPWWVLAVAWTIGLAQAATPVPEAPRATEYAAVQARLQRGWNTWDTNSVTRQVLLPEGLGISLGVRRRSSENTDAYLPDALIGRQGKADEKVFPGPHAYDGSYSALRLTWRGVDLRLETAQADGDLVMLVTPLSGPARWCRVSRGSASGWGTRKIRRHS